MGLSETARRRLHRDKQEPTVLQAHPAESQAFCSQALGLIKGLSNWPPGLWLHFLADLEGTKGMSYEVVNARAQVCHF